MKNQCAKIKDFIENAAIKDLFTKDIELLMAVEYYYTITDNKCCITDAYSMAKKYIARNEHYSFKYTSLDNIISLVIQHADTHSFDPIRDIMEYLEVNTSLSPINIQLVIEEYKNVLLYKWRL